MLARGTAFGFIPAESKTKFIIHFKQNKMKKFDTIKKLLGVMIIMLVCSTTFAQIKVDIRPGVGIQVGIGTPQYDRYDKFGGNSLVIDTRGGRDFTVVVDNGQTYNSNGGAIAINSLYNGGHRITIYERTRSFFGGHRQKMVYSGRVFLKPGTETSIFLTGGGQVVMNEKPIFRKYDRGNDRGWSNGRDNNGYDHWNK